MAKLSSLVGFKGFHAGSGLNTRMEASLFGPGDAQVATNVEVLSGALTGSKDLGPTAYTCPTGAATLWIWPIGNKLFLFDSVRRRAINDANAVYTTMPGDRAAMYDQNGDRFPLGIVPMQGISFSMLATGGSIANGIYAYAITFVIGQDDPAGVPYQSNKQPFDLIFNLTLNGPLASASNTKKVILGGTFVGGVATPNAVGSDLWQYADSRAVRVQIWRADVTGGAYDSNNQFVGYKIGTYTLIASLSQRLSGGTAFVDTVATPGTTIVTAVDATGVASVTETVGAAPTLTWDYGGYPGNTTYTTDEQGVQVSSQLYTADHAPAPVLTGLADRLQAQAQGAHGGTPGLGMAMGWFGPTLCWARNEAPLYWPLANRISVDQEPEAEIVHEGYAVVFTPAATFMLYGNTDDAQTLNELRSVPPIRAGWGRSAIWTPLGTFYVSQQGITVLEGQSGRVLSRANFGSGYFDDLVFYDAAFFNYCYYLFHSTGYLRVDVRDGLENARFTSSATVVQCAAYASWRVPMSGKALQWFPYPAAVATAALEGTGGMGTMGVYRSGVCSDWTAVNTTIAASITASASLQTVTVASGTGIGVGMKLQIGTGTSAEVVAVTAVSGTSVTAIFQKSHTGPGIVVLGGSRIYAAGGIYISIGKSGFTTIGSVVLPRAYFLDTVSAVSQWQNADYVSYTAVNRGPLVFLGGKVYQYSGTTTADNSTVTPYNGLQIFTPGGAWAVDGAAIPAALFHHAACADMSGGDTTHMWVHGGVNGGGAVSGATYRLNVGVPNTWTTLGTAGTLPVVLGHGLVYVPGSVFADGRARLFVFGGATSFTGGGDQTTVTNVVYCLDLTILTWTNDSTSDSGVSGAQAAGVPKRFRHVWAYDSVSQMIFLHGGKGSGGAALSDMWQFNPRTWVDRMASLATTASAWTNHTGTVLNLDDRFDHGGGFIGERLHIGLGTNGINLANDDFWAVDVDSLEAGGTAEGIYVAKNGDAGAVKRLEAGSLVQGTWQTGDMLGIDPATTKRVVELTLDYQGDVTVSAKADNGSVQQIYAFSSATRTQVRQRLPRFTNGLNHTARGRRLSLQFVLATAAAAVSGVAGKLWSCDALMVEDANANGAPSS